MPGMTQPPPAGRAEFFGVRVFWDERLDDHAGAL
jgi:hypothetical protein